MEHVIHYNYKYLYIHLEHDHLLSTHLLSTHLLSASLVIPSLAINTFAIKLICYQLSCFHIHLLSSLICYPASTAIDTLAIKPHLLSGQFAINPPLQSTIWLSIIICYQIFALLWIIILTNFFQKSGEKMKKFLKIWNSSVSGKLCVGMESARFVASSKGPADLKKKVESYDNMPMGIYMNNIVRFFKVDWVKI